MAMNVSSYSSAQMVKTELRHSFAGLGVLEHDKNRKICYKNFLNSLTKKNQTLRKASELNIFLFLSIRPTVIAVTPGTRYNQQAK